MKFAKRVSLCLQMSIALLLLLFASVASSQEFRGSITGTVTDPSGAVVPNAKVEVKNNATNVTTPVDANDKGIYQVQNLDPGQYTVTANSSGFKTLVRNNIDVRVGDKRTLDLPLEVGATSETVVITAEAPLLEPEQALGGTNISTAMVEDLPLLGSNPYSLIALTNGNSHVSAFPDHLSERPFDNGGMDGYSINGGPAGGNNNSYLIDGAPNNNNEGLGFVPPPDAVGEIKVITNAYDAEYGRTGGGITSVSLRTGTNSLHGSANWNFRNSLLNSNLTQLNAKGLPIAPYHWSEPTAVINGPVYLPHLYDGRNKTFFSYSFEYIYDAFPNPASRSYPSALERLGDFSQTLGANGQPVAIYDPLTTSCNASGTCTRQTFASKNTPGSMSAAGTVCQAGNTASCDFIPTTRIDPVMAKLLSLYPLPNISNCQLRRGCGTNYQTGPQTRGDHYHADTVRIDQTVSPTEKFFASFELGNRLEFISNEPNPSARGLYPASSTWRINHGATFNWTSILSPTTVNTAKVNWLRHNGLGNGADQGSDPTTLGLSPSLVSLFGNNNFPGVSFAGSNINYTGLSQGGRNATTFNTNWTEEDTLSKVVGKHGFKFGAVGIQTLQNNIAASLIPSLTFGDVFTRSNYLSADSNSGDAAADALLGYPTGGSYTNPLSLAYATKYFATFIQDDWRVAKNLTLNLGLRWDDQTPTTERYNRGVVGFNPTQSVCLGANDTLLNAAGSNCATAGGYLVQGALQYASGDNRSPYNKNLTNFQPRFGIGYQITKKMVFRGGWGRSYIQGYNFAPSTGFTNTTSVVTSSNGLNQAPIIPGSCGATVGLSCNGYAALFPTGLALPTGSSPISGFGNNVTYVDPNYKLPYVNSFNAALEFELPFRSMLHVEYNGSRTHRLSVNKPINVLPVGQYLSLGSAANASIANPFAGRLPGTSLNTATTTVGQLDLPFPQYTGVTENNIPIGSLTYDSLQVRYDKRLSHGLTFLATYTWSKNLGKTSYANPNYDCLDCLRKALVNIDQPQLLSLSMTYTETAFTTGNRFLKAALGGWTIAGTAQFQSGSLLAAPTANGTGVFVQSTGINPEAPTSAWTGQSLAREFNTCTIAAATGARSNCLSATEPAAWIIQNQFGLNGVSPFFSNMRAKRPPIANLSVFKSFQIYERLKFELRGEALNLTNTPWFSFGDNSAGVSTNASTSTFGQANSFPIFNQGNDPRIIQVAGRISF